MNKKIINSGVILFNNKIKNGKEIKKWLYNISEEFISCDQFSLNCCIQEFNLNIGILDTIYNMDPSNNKLDEAFIIHATGKFWDKEKYTEWDENNLKWIELGGTKYNPLYVQKKKTN